MKYFLWINGKSVGPHDESDIRGLLETAAITAVTLARVEGGKDEWNPVSSFPNLSNPKAYEVPAPTGNLAYVPKQEHRSIVESIIADVLMIIAALALLAAPIGGWVVGSKTGDASLGWIIFGSGSFAGLVLLGFAKIIEPLNEAAQRLRQIESRLAEEPQQTAPLKQLRGESAQRLRQIESYLDSHHDAPVEAASSDR
jgi:hypothetical protein